MNSMTGFGRATVEKLGHNITVEIKTVNHRFLDFNIRMPRAMLFLEDDIRNAIKSHLFRGGWMLSSVTRPSETVPERSAWMRVCWQAIWKQVQKYHSEQELRTISA